MIYRNNLVISDEKNPLELNKKINSNLNIEEPIQIIIYENNENYTNLEEGFPDFFKDGKDSSLNNEKKLDFNIETLKEDKTKEIRGLIEKKKAEEKKNEKKMENEMEEKEEKKWKMKWKKKMKIKKKKMIFQLYIPLMKFLQRLGQNYQR